MKRAIVALATFALAGCAALPTTGPVRSAAPQIPAGYSVDVLAEGPREDASPREIVEGFLRAAAYGFSDGFAVARQFLAPGVAWDPTADVRVYSASKNPVFARGDDGGITVTIDQIATLDSSGRYADSLPTPASVDFTLVRGVDNQWRIAVLADGLLISDLNFKQTFSWSPLYFLTEDATTLVPDTRWYPFEERAAAVVRGLLAGPSGWLGPAVTTAFPDGAALGPGGVVVQDGIAVVDLSGAAGAVSDEARGLMLAQLHATLSAITAVSSVQLTVDGERLDSGEQARELELPTSVASPVMLSNGALVRFNGRDLVAVEGVGEMAGLAPSHPAVPFEDVDAPIVVLSGGVRLVTVPRTDTRSTVLYEEDRLVPPSIDRHGWIWTASVRNGGTATVVTGDGVVGSVAAPWLADREVTHLRVSADGARVVVVSRQADATRIELAAVIRDRTGMPLILGEPLRFGEALANVSDVSWVDQSTVAVLGSVLSEPADRVYLLTLGGTTQALPLVEDAVAVAANRNARSLVVATADGRLYVRNGIGWREAAESVSDPAFSG